MSPTLENIAVDAIVSGGMKVDEAEGYPSE